MNSTFHPIQFTKMHALGNDFVVINAVDQMLDHDKLPITALANRHTGIGFDQLLIIEPSQQADFFCRIFNADGSEAEQCGNGLRCVARFLHEEKLHEKPNLHLETKAGVFSIRIDDYDHIRVMMGTPHIQHPLTELKLNQYQDTFAVSILSLGNPHTIVKVDSVDAIATDQLGAAIATHTFFPNGTNVGFLQILTPQHIRLRTYERGAGETCACGSNACAAAVAGIANGWLKQQVRVEFRYGSLLVEWDGMDKPIYLTGPASRVFSGQFAGGLLN